MFLIIIVCEIETSDVICNKVLVDISKRTTGYKHILNLT